MKKKKNRIVTMLCLIVVLNLPLYVWAQDDLTFLGSEEGFDMYLRHADQGDCCFMVEDMVLSEQEVKSILRGYSPSAFLIDEMNLVLRHKDTLDPVSADLVSVDYSSLKQISVDGVCPIRFSYQYGTAPVSITAYVFVSIEQIPTESEEPQTEPQTNPPETAVDIETESETRARPVQPTETEPSGTEPAEPPEVIYREEVIVRPEVPETERETEPEESERQTEPEDMINEHRIVEKFEYETETGITETETETEEESQEQSMSLLLRILNTPVFVGTFGTGGIALFLFVVSIFWDLKVLWLYKRKMAEFNRKYMQKFQEGEADK